MGANLAPSTTLPFINSALYVPFGGTSLGRLSIRKENARKGSESKENSNLRRLSMAGYFLKKWEGEQKMPALSAEIGQKKVGFVTEPNFQLKCFSFTL